MKLNNLDDLRLLIADSSYINFQIIRAKENIKSPPLPYVTFELTDILATNEENSEYQTIKKANADGIEQEFVRITKSEVYRYLVTFESISYKQDEAYRNLDKVLQALKFQLRTDINLLGYGIDDRTISSILNRHLDLNDKKLYRFFFDVEIYKTNKSILETEKIADVDFSVGNKEE